MTFFRSTLAICAICLGLSACATENASLFLSQDGDSLTFQAPWDSISEVADTMIVDGDTVIIMIVDTIIEPTDTVFVAVVDTVVNGIDTVIVNRTDTIVQSDTVIMTRIDTIVIQDTIIVVDTVVTPPPVLEFSVQALSLTIGQSQTLTVTITNVLGIPVPPGSLTWISSDPAIASVDQGGRVTGVASGSTTVFVIDDASSVSGSLNVTVQAPPAPPLPPPPTGVWFEENWDYADTNEMLSDPNGWLFKTPNAPIVLVTDPAAPWSTRKAAMTQMSPSAGSGGFDVFFPKAGTDRPREIWQETWIKFSPDWKTNWGKSGNPDHKTFQWYDQNPSGTRRWSLKFGVFGSGIQASATANYFLGIDGPGQVQQLDLPAEFWDGEWHRVRVHLSMGTGNGSDGIFEIMVDGTLIASDRAADTSAQGPDHYFNQTALGRNMNQVPDTEIEVYYGLTRVWISNPGWIWQ